MTLRLRRSCWLLLLGVSLHSTSSFLQNRALRRDVLLTASATEVLRPAVVAAEGFDPFGEEIKKKVPKDLKNPPADVQVTPSGLKWKLLKKVDCEVEKCAKPKAFDKVSVAFTGWEPETGNEFLSSRTRGRVQFFLGDVIRGWGEGLKLMNVNETARLWIPGDLAFGSDGKNGPSGDIVIDVTLYGIRRGRPVPPTPELTPPADAMVEPSGLKSKIIKEGNGTETASEANKVSVEWYGWTADGQLFDSSLLRGNPVSDVQQSNVPKGFWEGAKLMKPGETRRFWVPPELGYGAKRTDGGPCGPLVFDINLESFDTGFNPFR